jgi:hypothetical protein
MDKIRDVAVLVGSLRKDSINRKVANALAEVAPAGLKPSISEIGLLPIYNQDGDEIRRRNGRRFASASGQPTRFFASRPSRAEERDRYRLAPLWQERMER